jgi:hypothetical protein
MGSYTKIIITPDVSLERITSFVKKNREEGFTGKLILRTLEDKKPRKALAKLAQKLGYREIDPGGLIGDDFKGELNDAFGAGNWFYRHDHDEFSNVYYPNRKWLSKIFGTSDLNDLMESDSDPITWNQTVFYSYPKNPSSWDISIAIDCKCLNVAQINQERECPNCGHIYSSKRQDLCQCPKCIYVDKPFETIEDACTILVDKNLNTYGEGRCPRCEVRITFGNVIEQCGYCGQIAKGISHPKGQGLIDNEEQIRTLLSEYKSPNKSMQRKKFSFASLFR